MNTRLASIIISSVAALGLLLAGCSKDEDSPVIPPADHFQPEGLVILAGGDTVASYFQGVVRPGDTLRAPAANNLSPHWAIRFMNANRQHIAPPSGGTHRLGWTIAHNDIAELTRDPGDEWDFHLRGKAVGTTTLVLRVLHGDHADFVTQPFPVLVDSTIHGEVAAILVLDEESGDTLATASSQGVTGGFSVQRDSTTDHAVVYFLDEQNVRFQPEVPPYALGYAVADTSTLDVIPAGVDEPWAFQLRGKNAGSTTVVFRLLAGSTVEWSSPAIPVTVLP